MIESLQLIVERILFSMKVRYTPITPRVIREFSVEDGWIKFTYLADRMGDDYRYIPMFFDANLALEHNEVDGHEWKGEWFLDGETLHCIVCGIDGT